LYFLLFLGGLFDHKGLARGREGGKICGSFGFDEFFSIWIALGGVPATRFSPWIDQWLLEYMEMAWGGKKNAMALLFCAFLDTGEEEEGISPGMGQI